MRRSFLILVMLGIVLITMAEEYTLDDLINVGLEESFEIKQEKLSNLNTKSEVRSSWISALPSANIALDGSKNFDLESDWENSASFSLTKNIMLNDPSYYNIRTALLNKKNADLSLKYKRKIIAFTIFTKYLNVLESQQNLVVQRKNLKLQKMINQQIEIQFNSGDKSALELQQSKLSLIDYEIAVNETENNLLKMRNDLFAYLNLKDEGYKLVEPKLNTEFDDIEFKANIAIKQKKNMVKSSRLMLLQQKMNFLPTVSLGYSVTHNDPNNVYDLGNYDRFNNSLSLNASYNIFSIFETREVYVRSKRNLRSLKLDLSKSKHDNQNEFENKIIELKTLKRSRAQYHKKLELANKTLDMAREQYKHGLISLLDLDRSKLEYQNAQISYISKKYELLRKIEEVNLLLSNKILGKW